MNCGKWKKCKICGKEYFTKSDRQTTCSKNCSKKYTLLASKMGSEARSILVRKHKQEYHKIINNLKFKYLYL